jgi:GT2 family glycosyltransferase
MSSSQSDVAVVLPNLDGGEPLLATLASTPPSGEAELVVVDNGSRPQEIEQLRRHPRRPRVLELGGNRGFAGACNAGIAATAAPLVLLLNNDARLAPDCLAALCNHLLADERLAAVQALVLEDDGGRIDTAGIEWTHRGEAVPIGRGAAPPASPATSFAVAGVSATVALYRRAALLDVAGAERVLCPEFFAYYEDVDLSLRLLRRGWSMACVPAARAWHLGSFTGRRRPWRRDRLLARNRWWTLRRNFSSRFLVAAICALLRADLAHARRCGLRGALLLVALPYWLARAPRLEAGAGEKLARLPLLTPPAWLRTERP